MAGAARIARKPKAPPAPALPPSHLDILRDAGFEVVFYLNRSVEVDKPALGLCDEAQARNAREWLPRLAIAPGLDGKGYRVLEWLPAGHPANAYGFDGWQPSCGHSAGGMHRDIHGALGWFRWIVQARKRNYFGKPAS